LTKCSVDLLATYAQRLLNLADAATTGWDEDFLRVLDEELTYGRDMRLQETIDYDDESSHEEGSSEEEEEEEDEEESAGDVTSEPMASLADVFSATVGCTQAVNELTKTIRDRYATELRDVVDLVPLQVEQTKPATTTDQTTPANLLVPECGTCVPTERNRRSSFTSLVLFLVGLLCGTMIESVVAGEVSSTFTPGTA
jgi:hypothetical protein